MKDELFFFSRSDFHDLRISEQFTGREFRSITDFINDRDLARKLKNYALVVDLTTLTSYKDIQDLAETTIPLIANSVKFIAVNNQKELLEFELRYCFASFKDWVPKGKEIKNVKESTALPKHIHRKITDFSDEELQYFFEKFRNRLYGHEKFKDELFELIKTFRVFNKINEHKILSVFLLGDSGVGKTEVAHSIYDCLGGTKKLAKVNFGNYSSEFSLSSLIGSARGYIGSDDGEIFIRIRDTDVGVILIDEFEKSNATLFNYFLDVLESGKIISSLADELDLNGFIIIFTSNISKEDFASRISPELRSRFDYKGQFTLLHDEDKKKYVEFRVKSVVEKFNKKYGVGLPNNLHEYFLTKINVSAFKNMRDLNKKIKSVYVEYITLEMQNGVSK